MSTEIGKLEVKESQAKFYIKQKKEGHDQSSYNIPKEIFDFLNEKQILEEVEIIEGESLKKNSEEKYFILSNEYKFEISQGIKKIIENSEDINKFICMIATNKKCQLKRRDYKKLSKNKIGYNWFVSLYDNNIIGSKIIFKLDENQKKFILDIDIYNISKLSEKTDYDKKITQEKNGLPFNYLVFGSPGTGKSYLLEEERKKYFNDNNFERVTFYDGYTYGQFVGSYKPKVKEEDNITYEYIPGPFMKMLVEAFNNPEDNYLVLIEELNRAKADSVFGDIFQLLDREKNGESKYRIAISEDQEAYLKEQGLELEKLCIPNNLYIWATMNSADQGVYPLDTAFKRRWSYEYLTLNSNEEYFGSLNGEKEEKYKNYKINIGNDQEVEWNKFRRKINEIVSKGNASEDRMLAPFFLVPEDFKKIREKEEIFILNDEVHKFKLLSYVFDDLLMYDKKSKGQIFNSEIKTFSTLIEKYNENLKDVYSEEFRKEFKDLETNGDQ